MRAKAHGRIRSEKFPHEKFERAFQVCDAHIFVDVKTFDLVELRAMGGVHFVAAIGRTGCDHSNGRRR